MEVQGNAHTKLKWKLYKNTNVRGREGPVLPGVSDSPGKSCSKAQELEFHPRTYTFKDATPFRGASQVA